MTARAKPRAPRRDTRFLMHVFSLFIVHLEWKERKKALHFFFLPVLATCDVYLAKLAVFKRFFFIYSKSLLYFNKHSVVPKEERDDAAMRPGKVITYQLSDEELAKYRNLPPVEGKRSISLPYRKKKK